nr:transposase [Corynebacterium variabile]
MPPPSSTLYQWPGRSRTRSTSSQLAAEKLTGCRQDLEWETTGRRGRKVIRCTSSAGRCCPRRTSSPTGRNDGNPLSDTDDDYVAVQVTYAFYQDQIGAYGHPDRTRGKTLMSRVIDTLRKVLPAAREELAQLGRTLWRRRADILAYFDTGASNGLVEATNGRLEHLRGIALRFRNPDHYILRSLIHSGRLQDRINALQIEKGR